MSNIEQEIREEEAQRGLNFGLWRRLLVHAKPYRWSLIGMGVAGVLLAVAESFMPSITGWILDAATDPASEEDLISSLIGYGALAVCVPVLIFGFINLAGIITTGFAHDMRRAAFQRLQELSFSFFDKRNVGWLMARLTSDCGRIAGILPWFLLDLVWGFSMILGISVMMFWLNPTIALQVMFIVPPLVLISLYFQKKLIKSQRAVRKTNSLITSSYNEGIMGVRTTKTLVRENENLEEFQDLSSVMFQESVRNAIQSSVYLPLVITLGSVGMGIALWRCGLALGEGMTLGTLVAFVQYATLFYMPIQEIAQRFTQFQAAQASAERLQGLLDTVPEIKDSHAVLKRQNRQKTDGSATPSDQIHEVDFKNVSFAYKEDEPVLSDFNLSVKRGDRIALVGATGSGKTTIVNLLARFYEPTKGRIEINGVEYRELGLHWLQSKLGIVLQAPHLFRGSVRENIRYGRLEAHDSEVQEAARTVHADTFINQMDEGYETDVGENGNRLSTGQKQLIALARAVLAEPQIFIMDEATSSVDTETERTIQEAVERVLSGRISFVIAHRLSTVRSASRILVIGKGRIQEQGTHAELLGQRGHYYKLYTNQFIREGQEKALKGDQ